jgi:hypothetical protein
MRHTLGVALNGLPALTPSCLVRAAVSSIRGATRLQTAALILGMSVLTQGSSGALAQGDVDEDGCEVTAASTPCVQKECYTYGWKGQETNECNAAGTTIVDHNHDLAPRAHYSNGEYWATYICTNRDGTKKIKRVHGTGTYDGEGKFMYCNGPSQSLKIYCGPTPACLTKRE